MCDWSSAVSVLLTSTLYFIILFYRAPNSSLRLTAKLSTKALVRFLKEGSYASISAELGQMEKQHALLNHALLLLQVPQTWAQHVEVQIHMIL